MKHAYAVALLWAAILVVSISEVSQAQRRSRRPEGLASLGEMSCRANRNGSYRAIFKEVNVGIERFTAVAKLGDGYLYLDKPQLVICRLAERGRRNEFSSLSLIFGLSDENKYSQGSVVRLLIYLDGELLNTQDISSGRKYEWNIDVQDVNSIALELQCIKAATTRERVKNRCPDVFFFEDILEK